MLRSIFTTSTLVQPMLTQLAGLIIGWFLSTNPGFAQIRPAHDTTVYVVVEQQPEFPGGMSALSEYMRKNVHYPPEAQKAGINGRVFVSFIVETDGCITDVQLLKGIGYGCDEEAVRVVSAMPRWKPGSQSGVPIRVKYNLPVFFGVEPPRLRK